MLFALALLVLACYEVGKLFDDDDDDSGVCH